MPSQRVSTLGANSSSAPSPKLAQPSMRPTLSAVLSELGPVSTTSGSPGERAICEALDRRNDIWVPLSSGFEHNLDAAILLVAERAVHFGTVGQRDLVRNDEARVDLAVFDPVEQIVGPARHVALSHAEGQALVHRQSPRDLVVEPAVDAHNGDHAGGAADVDHLAKNVWPVALRHDHLLGAVHDRIGLL